MSVRTTSILEDFISSLDLSGDVISFSDDGTNTLLVVENSFHARQGMPIEIDSVPNTIISATKTSIEVQGVLVDPVSFKLDPPFYFHGTPIAVNNFIAGGDSNLKYPMVWLYEIFQEVDNSILDGIIYQAQVRMFFLDIANYEDWNTDDHYEFVINGLHRLIDQFIIQLLNNGKFYQENESYTRTAHPNFGIFVENQGHKKHIFDDYTSGVQLRFGLNVRRNNCNT